MERLFCTLWKALTHQFVRRFILIGIILLPASMVFAKVAGPGWMLGRAESVSPQQASDYYLFAAQNALTASSLTVAAVPKTAVEITALARALQHDPKLIYEFVHNHIDYVPYYGYLKGPVLTLLDRSGNDFDQAALMIALLRASGYRADFVFGQMTIPNFAAPDQRDMQHWLGIDANPAIITELLSGGGIPATVSSTRTTLDRVWVQATVNGTLHLFDPAFKRYTRITGVDLKAKMGYLRSDLLAAAGGVVGTDDIQNLDVSGLGGKLVGYAATLKAYLHANLANAKMSAVVGGREIIPEHLTPLPGTLVFPTTVSATWAAIPAVYTHTVRVQHGGIDHTFTIPEVAAHKLAITYNTGLAAASTVSLQASSTPVTITPPVPVSPLGETLNSTPVSGTGGTLTTQALPTTIHPTVDFGRVTPAFGGWPSWSLTYTNKNSVTISIAAILLNNPGGAYRFLSGGDTTTLSPGQSVSIRIQFNGTGQVRGSRTATFRLVQIYNGFGYASDDWPLKGFVAQAPRLGLSGYTGVSAYFNVPANSTVNLNNNGSYGLSIAAVMTLAGTNPGRFQLNSGEGTGTIAAAGSRAINWRYLANAVGSHHAYINVRYRYDGITYPAGNLIPLNGTTTAAPAAQLWLDDTLIAQETAPISGGLATKMTLSINHPYAAAGGTYADQTSDYNLKRGSTYVILSEFGGSKDGRLLKQRQRKLDKLRASGLVDTSREVLTESLNVMGQTWMRQTTLSDTLLAEIAGVISIRHHRFGVIAQEASYYIDVRDQLVSVSSRHHISADEHAVFRASNFLDSAMEHGVLEQIQGINRPAVSTVRLLSLANQRGEKIFRATAANWATVKPQLTGYSATDLSTFSTRLNAGAILILPANGQITFNQWRGKGYIDSQEKAGGNVSVGMIIGGDLFGGFLSLPARANPLTLATEFQPELALKVWKPHPVSAEPVDLVSGAYLYNHSDLSLGKAEPNGLHFKRRYNSDDRYNASPLGNGWDHSYNIVLNRHSDAASGLGQRAPADALATLVASVVTLDLMRPTVPTLKDWTTATLMGQWTMDQLFDNALSVHLLDKALTYIKLPDGSYNPPPGITTTLVNTAGRFALHERFGTVITFDANNKVSAWTDVDGNTMNFAYSGKNLSTVTDSVGRTLTFAYAGSRLRSVTDSSGRRVGFGYNANGDQTGFTDAGSKKWGFGYDHQRRMTTISDPLNTVLATNTYDALDDVATQRYPRDGGTPVTFNYDFSGFRNVEEDSDGHQTVHFINAQGRTVAIQDALGHQQKTVFDGQGHVVLNISARKKVTWFRYDNNQNLRFTVNALHQQSENVYDSQFQRIRTLDPLGNRTRFAYDSKHHRTLTTDALGNTVGASYYPDGRTRTTTDGRNSVTTLTYDAFGNPATTQTGAHPPVSDTYNALGQRTSLTDQTGATTRFSYDKRGLVTSITDPLLQTTHFVYDAAGRLHTRTDRNGQTVSFAYTPSGKTKTITYPDGSSVAFTYTPAWENVASMTDSLGTSRYTYDAARRLTSQTDANGFKVDYAYDAAGNLTLLTYPDKETVSYTYDALNRLSTVSLDGLGQTTRYTYDPAGRLTQRANFNGTLTQYRYDNAGRLTGLTHRIPGGKTIASEQFPVLDGNGNRVQEIREAPQVPVSLAVATTHFHYNPPANRLLSTTNTTTDSFTYDAQGQTLTKNGTPYTWDDEHRLTGQGNSQYFYNRVGNRLKAINHGITTKYIYDARGNLIAEANARNAITRDYIYGAGLLAMIQNNNVYTYHHDALGNTVAITNNRKAIVNVYSYTPLRENCRPERNTKTAVQIRRPIW